MTKPSIVLPVSEEKSLWLKSTIRDIPDFPKPGIVFKDLTTLLKDKDAFKYVIDVFAERFSSLNAAYIAGIEARGFILGPSIAHRLNIGFIPIRKPGKLPHRVFKQTYQLEYGTDVLELHQDATNPGDKVVLIDDLLATGGTAAAAHLLLQKVGADVVCVGFVVELGFLNGRTKMPAGTDVFSILQY